MGLNVAYAEEEVVHTYEAAEQTGNQPTTTSIETTTQEQSFTVGDSEDSENSSLSTETVTENLNFPTENESGSETIQDQSTNGEVTQNQDVIGEAIIEQDQFANGTVCQEQSVNASVSCNDKIESDSQGPLDQKQTTSVEANQAQMVTSSDKVEAEQKQGTGIKAEQLQEVLLPEGESYAHSQGTDALTNQNQTISANNEAYLFQVQDAEVINTQTQQLSIADSIEDKQEQLTTIVANQGQSMSTFGSAKMEQTQTAAVKSYLIDTLENVVDIGINVTTRNYIEVFKDTTNSLIKIIQEILVNDELVDVVDYDYALEENDSHASLQTFHKEYEWGSLIVENSSSILFSEQLKTYQTSMTSFLSLVFGFGKTSNGVSDEPTPNEDEELPSELEDGNTEEEPAPAYPEDDEEEELPPESNDGENGVDPVPAAPVGSDESDPKPNQGDKSQVSFTPVTTELEDVTPIKINSGDNNVQTPANNENQLPNTATNTFNYLLLGILLVSAGTVVFWQRRRV